MKETKFKQTEIGMIPDDWEVKEINDICKNFSYGVGAEAKTFDYENKYIRITDIDDKSHKFLPQPLTSPMFFSDKSLVCKNDILIARTGASVGKTYLYDEADGNLIFAGFLMRINVFNNNPNLVFYNTLTNRYTRWVLSESMRSGQPGLNLKQLKAFKLPLPPTLAEQRKIAKALSDVDNVISTLEKLIIKKKNLKQGTMQQLLTGKKRLPGFAPAVVEPVETPAFKQTEIGEIPEDWEVVKIKSFAKVFDGTHQTPNYVDVGIPFYSVENVTADDFEHTKYITQQEHKLLSLRVKIEKGDILMTRIGSIGDCRYVDWEPNASFYVSLALIKCNNKVDPRYISYYSNSEQFHKELELRSLFYAIPQKINLGPISEITICMPEKKEQTAIANFISDMDKEIKELCLKLEKYQNLKIGMMQQLLTGKIRLI